MMMKSKTRALFLVVAIAFTMLAAVPLANALTVNLNIFNGSPVAGPEGPAGGAGEFWNQVSTTSASNLSNSAGGATTVGFTSGGNSWGGPDTWSNPSLGVIRDGLRNFDTNPLTSNQNLHINNLTPGAVFDVWIASANTLSSQRSQGEWTMVNATTSPSVQTVDNTLSINGTTWELGNNYVVFRNVVVDLSGEIVLTGHARRDNNFDTRLPLNGFQLVEVVRGNAIPEPATATLGLLAFGGLMLRRRRAA